MRAASCDVLVVHTADAEPGSRVRMSDARYPFFVRVGITLAAAADEILIVSPMQRLSAASLTVVLGGACSTCL